MFIQMHVNTHSISEVSCGHLNLAIVIRYPQGDSAVQRGHMSTQKSSADSRPAGRSGKNSELIPAYSDVQVSVDPLRATSVELYVNP